MAGHTSLPKAIQVQTKELLHELTEKKPQKLEEYFSTPVTHGFEEINPKHCQYGVCYTFHFPDARQKDEAELKEKATFITQAVRECLPEKLKKILEIQGAVDINPEAIFSGDSYSLGLDMTFVVCNAPATFLEGFVMPQPWKDDEERTHGGEFNYSPKNRLVVQKLLSDHAAEIRKKCVALCE